MKTKCLKMVVLLLAVSLVAPALAEWNVWTGRNSTEYMDAGNWSLGKVPSLGDPCETQINGSASNPLCVIDSGDNAQYGSALYGPEFGATLTVTGSGTTLTGTNGPTTVVGAYDADPGTLNVLDGAHMHVADLLVGWGWWFDEGVIGNAVVNVDGADTQIDLDWSLWLGGEVNLYDGVININTYVNFGWVDGALDIHDGDLYFPLDDGVRNYADEFEAFVGNGNVTAYGQPGVVGYNIIVDRDTENNLTHVYTPEPMTIALLGLGSLLIRRRKA